MKKVVSVAACLLTLIVLCSCQGKERSEMKSKTNSAITVVNKLTDADVWILPQTAKNLKTTVWGKATASKVKTGESREAELCEAGDDGLYILRMIDTDSFYYSANGLKLQAGRTITISEDDAHFVTAAVTDESGAVVNTYEVFSARL